MYTPVQNTGNISSQQAKRSNSNLGKKRETVAVESTEEERGYSEKKPEVGPPALPPRVGYSKNEHQVKLRRNKMLVERRNTADLTKEVLQGEADTEGECVMCKQEMEEDVTKPVTEGKRKEEGRKTDVSKTPEIQSFPIHAITVEPEKETLKTSLQAAKW